MSFEAFAQEYNLKANQPLAALSWLKTGGDADWFFTPYDQDELAAFLRDRPKDLPIYPMGLGSNTIIRDGGVAGVVIRLGRAFMNVEIDGDHVIAGAALMDQVVAKKAADAGLDLSFLRTIPGAIGGAVAMNAGCYGVYMADVCIGVDVLMPSGEARFIPASEIAFSYRNAELPEGAIILRAYMRAPKGEPAALHAKMEEQLSKREKSQPVKDRTCGSTFRNPAGFSSTGAAGEDHSLKAWKVIDEAGMRGARLGGAEMNAMHPNFLTNRDNATAFDLEALGEKVRREVKRHSGIELTWEIKRVGRFLPEQKPDWECLE